MPHHSIPADRTGPFACNGYAFGSYLVTNAVATIGDDFGFTADQLAQAKRAVLSAHGGNAHYRYDSAAGDPSGTDGHMLDQGTANTPQVIVGNANIQNLRFFRDDTTDAKVSITLEK